MSRKRRIGGMAATGLTAAIVLLAGLAPAEADELSDLRANQQLLQQRIDRLPLDQAPAPQAPGASINGGAAAVPDTPLPGGSFPRSFVIPGTDTSVRVGGSIDETFEHR